MTKVTRLCLLAFIFVISNGFADTSGLLGNFETTSSTSEIQRVRINFTTPNGFFRQLLLAFTPDNSATDGFDYGYDGLNLDAFPDDLNWMIDNNRYLIQGVGAFDNTKQYPLGLFLKNTGDIKIELDSLENFNTAIDVYIYDSLEDSYTLINESDYVNNISSGEYLNRFYIAFKEVNEINDLAKNSLSIEDESIKATKINYLSNTKELYINTNNSSKISSIDIYNIKGQKLYAFKNVNVTTIKIPLQSIRNQHNIVSIKTEYGLVSKQLIIN